jgi:hypothetical protein
MNMWLPQPVGREVYAAISWLNRMPPCSSRDRMPRALLVQSTTRTREPLTGQPATM